LQQENGGRSIWMHGDDSACDQNLLSEFLTASRGELPPGCATDTSCMGFTLGPHEAGSEARLSVDAAFESQKLQQQRFNTHQRHQQRDHQEFSSFHSVAARLPSESSVASGFIDMQSLHGVGGDGVLRDSVSTTDQEYFAKVVAEQSMRNGNGNNLICGGQSFVPRLGNPAQAARYSWPSKPGFSSDVKNPSTSGAMSLDCSTSELQLLGSRFFSGIKMAAEQGRQTQMIVNNSSNGPPPPNRMTVPLWQTNPPKPAGFRAQPCYDDPRSPTPTFIAQTSVVGSHPPPQQFFQKFLPPSPIGFQPAAYFNAAPPKHHSQGPGFIINRFPCRIFPPIGVEVKQERAGGLTMETELLENMRFSDGHEFQQHSSGVHGGWKGPRAYSQDELDGYSTTHHADVMNAYGVNVGRMTPVLYGAGGEVVYDSSSSATSSVYGGARFFQDGKAQR